MVESIGPPANVMLLNTSNRTVDGEQERYEEVTLHIGKLPFCTTIFKSQLLYSDLQDVMYILLS